MRLTIAVLLTFVMFPLQRGAYQVDMSSFAPLLSLLFGELAVGFVMGLAVRIALTAVQVAGTVIATQLGLGFVTTVDPTQNQQGALLGTFFSLLGITLVFATNLHHVAIAALANSYQAFAPGVIPATGDALQLSLKMVSDAFRIGVQLSAPFLLFGLVFNVGLGLLGAADAAAAGLFPGDAAVDLRRVRDPHGAGRGDDGRLSRFHRRRARHAGRAVAAITTVHDRVPAGRGWHERRPPWPKATTTPNGRKSQPQSD